MKPNLLIVDDDEEIRSQLRWALADHYNVHSAGDRLLAMELWRQHRFPVVVLDLGLPPRPADPDEGLATLNALLEQDRNVKVIIVSGQGEKANALRAVADGAYDFLTKPVDVDELQVILRRAFYLSELERELRQLQAIRGNEGFEGMLGDCPGMQAVFQTVRRVAPSDVPVLILGESGTGKEMVARAIHRRSARRDGPFVPINCGAIPENLLESELFGHERGAFTGAIAQRKGRLEMAEGGTLFLDELGELPLPLQVKLLRFLQEQTIERVGGRELITVNARVIAATNADLKKAMEAGRFREDLYYRVAVVVIQLPPLRERGDDVVLLARTFLRRFATETNRMPAPHFSPAALRALQRHDWPGNVRELENRVRRAVIMAEGKMITAEDLELSDPGEAAGLRTLREIREAAERSAILSALRRHHWRVAPAAQELDVSRPTLYELMNRLGIQRPPTAE
ncbi:MAG: PEP-CTERM-box response regulator transcription factor [Verrucomicrobiota bacterium]|nr:PEP-CTERM-box response regulator transcription factor [Limisphaera sp.]MDW8382194.1 PEP-CTERM-box response regulator transcription factor [Verrucomicrobiota bacterium]